MPVIDVVNCKGEIVSQRELPDEVFNVPVKGCVLHEVVTMQLACRRSGTADVKNRSEIKGSTRKLYRQKGTGRARRGNIKSPLLRGGGVVFGPTPRSYAYKIPKKVKRLALKMALSNKFQENCLTIIDNLELDEIKTKKFDIIIRTLNKTNALFVIPEKDHIIEMSSKNIPSIKVLRCEGLNVYDILKYESLILVESTIKAIEERLTA